VIDVSDEEAKTVPHIGLNKAIVSDDDFVFHKSSVRFEALSGQQTDIEVPLVAKLKDGELAVVLQWTQGSKVNGEKVELHDLDLHVEFQPADTVKCTVDSTFRQCNGVKLTTDRFYSEDSIKHVQAAKFDRIGDFNYMVYASRTKNMVAKTAEKSKNVQIEATLSVFSPHHKEAVYEVSLPFYNADIMERYWIGFCLRGG